MEKAFDVKQILRVFQKIMDHGQVVESGKQINQMTASTDFDGYTVFMEYRGVKLSLFFHNAYKFDFKHSKELDEFMDVIQTIDRMKFK